MERIAADRFGFYSLHKAMMICIMIAGFVELTTFHPSFMWGIRPNQMSLYICAAVHPLFLGYSAWLLQGAMSVRYLLRAP